MEMTIYTYKNKPYEMSAVDDGSVDVNALISAGFADNGKCYNITFAKGTPEAENLMRFAAKYQDVITVYNGDDCDKVNANKKLDPTEIRTKLLDLANYKE